MASVIPDNLLSNRTVRAAHRRVGKALIVGLDPTAVVWFEPPFEPEADRRRPDFVILDPSLGLVVVQVFEHTDGDQVLGALRGELRVAHAGGEAAVPNPFQMAESFVAELRGRLAGDAQMAMVPVAGVAAFPHVDRTVAEALGFDSVVPLERCLFSGEIDALVRDDDSVSLARVFNRALEGGVDDLIDERVQAQLRAVIHPEVVIGSAPEQGALFVAEPTDGDVALRVMDLHQERFAKRINPGHRVIHGVAGSGKTLILVARARLLARMYPTSRILVTCFTKSLASVLRAQLSSCSNVEVENLDALAFRLVAMGGAKFDFKGPRSIYSVALDSIARQEPRKYRAVLVDEAQDFDDDALKLCTALAEPGADGMGDVLIVADASQRIYDRKFTWSAAGIQARGRTSVLRQNYRNTKEVLTFAKAFVAADLALDGPPVVAAREDLDLEEEALVVPAEATERRGPLPVLYVEDDVTSELRRVVDIVRGWYAHELPSRSIAVLMQSGTDADRASTVVAGLEQVGIPAFWVTESKESKEKVGLVDEAVVVSTIHSAKGLEFPRVVVCGLNQRGSGDWIARNRNTNYVGFTRAIDELAVVTSRSSPYLHALREAVQSRSSD